VLGVAERIIPIRELEMRVIVIYPDR